ncbi:hypothetical protein Q5I06_01520 [Helicobacter sp. faydin-H76]|uniref:DUF177 domain-containing protein n=2 Tax=Helicobacter cappadocius TaxID=3063998 RepID=A0AA90PJT3_9HELI|nr:MULTISPECIES: hypothetical protein [unclassified Helicobacter]MDO7252597.1 hypothetical protein [Helicobacter sp. faydin-H75]MDP2538464.1 hypothetical protein [Helicobacter sp. faydin-H76]
MRKITQLPKTFSITSDGIELKGQIYRKTSKIFQMEAILKGSLELICDISGDLFVKFFEQPLVLYISDGIWDIQSQNSRLDDFDIIEFFDGFVDVEYILQSEIESIKMDYHIKEEQGV